MYDSLQTEAEMLRAEGGKPLTQRMRFADARVALSAWTAELNDPEPDDAPHRCTCEDCLSWMLRVSAAERYR